MKIAVQLLLPAVLAISLMKSGLADPLMPQAPASSQTASPSTTNKPATQPKPYVLLVHGHIPAGAFQQWKFNLPKGVAEFLADIRRSDKTLGEIAGRLEVTPNVATKETGQTQKFAQKGPGLRSALQIGVDEPTPEILRLTNDGSADLEFWLYCLRPTASPVPPLFGVTIPERVAPGRPSKGSLSPGETHYFRFQSAESPIAVGVTDADGAGFSQAGPVQLAFFEPHGQPIPLDNAPGKEGRYGLLVASHGNRPASAVLQISNYGPKPVQFSIAQLSPGHSTSAALAPVSPGRSWPAALPPPVIPPIQLAHPVQIQLEAGKAYLLQAQLPASLIRVTLRITGAHHFASAGRVLIANGPTLEKFIAAIVLKPTEEERERAVVVQVSPRYPLTLAVANFGQQPAKYTISIDEVN